MRTNGGTDFIMKQCFGSPSTTPATVMVLSTDTATPAATDSTYASEINAAGGGLNRKTSIYAHTSNTNSSTLTGTFTMNSSDGTTKTPTKFYITDSTTAGGSVPYWENLISNPSGMSPGDSLTLTETLTFT